ncbi:MAG: PPC domain-containing protein [Thermoguttaceae bacterium]
MSPFPRCFIAALLVVLVAVPVVQAQQNVPHAGYAYPAGGRQGETIRVTVGGQFLERTAKAYVSGRGIQAKLVECIKPLTPKQVNDLRERLEQLRKKQPKDAETLKEMLAIRDKLNDFQNKRANPVLADKVILQLIVAADAELGPRELRLAAPNGLSNPLVFQVGQLPEFRKPESKPAPPPSGDQRPQMLRDRNRGTSEQEMTVTLPAVVNGQIMPGGVDRYRFQARRGQHLVVAVAARELRPYLADAVPGWFQAALAIRDPSGNELAYSDHYRFRPDPALYYKIPKSGQYTLEIRDTLYRGREDFVYRVALGELPYITGVFPLGGQAGKKTSVELIGCNLHATTLTVDATGHAAGILPICVHNNKLISNYVPFALDSLPECLEQEPNDDPAHAQPITLPMIVNGRIDRPGDVDVFRFEGHAGQKIVAQVDARKLGSPLDSILRLTDADGRQLAINDDYDDKSAGLLTHHADSLIAATLPADGAYYLHLADVQQKGGAEFAYRLRVSEPRPDFALLVTPPSISVRAGASVPIAVHVVRKDGFAGEIVIKLKNAPKGFALSGARIPTGQDETKLTLTAPRTPSDEPVALHVEGRATIEGRPIVRQAIPAEDMMQAFAYHHLVPVQSLTAAVIGPERFRPPWRLLDKPPVKLVAGGTASLRFSMPRGPQLEKVLLTLHDPPAGVSIEKVSLTSDGATVVLTTDPEKVKPGQRGNLIVDASVERMVNPKNAKAKAQKRTIPLGSLPAIPFEIVARQR